MSSHIPPWITVLFVLTLVGCDVSRGIRSGAQQTDDPVTLDFPIAYIERPLPSDDDNGSASNDLFTLTAFNPGARLIIKDRAAASARETAITADLFEPTGPDAEKALYDVKDLSVSTDGERLLFSVRAPSIPGADDNQQPTWNIWEYNHSDETVRRIIDSDNFAEEGHDLAAQYLPSGEIVFSSNRQRRTRAVLLDEGKSQYSGLDDKRQNEAFTLHIMNADGTNLRQLTFNGSHDLYPTVLDSGELLYLRWDAIANQNRVSLYKTNTDGTNTHLHYGFHSQNTGTNDSEAVFYKPFELQNGRIMAILRPRATLNLGGDVIAIDGANYVDIDQPTDANRGASGPGQISLIGRDLNTDGLAPSLGGHFNSAYPLYDGTDRLLVSWSQCRLLRPGTGANAPCTRELLSLGAAQAAPLFGLWIYDLNKGTQLPVKIPEEGTMFTDAVVLEPRPQAASYSPPPVDADLVAEAVGVVHIRSVYDFAGDDSSAPGGSITAVADPTRIAPDIRPRRFIRLVKNVPIPNDDVLDFNQDAFGASRAQSMRDILGYVPIEPDGSAKFKVPADVPFTMDLVDASGRRSGGRHNVWLSVRPGEERQCNGCHRGNNPLPHGRLDAEAASANTGALGGIAFPNTLLLGAPDAPQAPDEGETMAEYYARVNGPRTPSMDMIFEDEWTDPASTTPGQPIQYRYQNIAATVNANPRDPNCSQLANAPPTWQPPTACYTTDSWNSLCRTTLNYVEHIHPLWEADRRSCDENGNVLTNGTCTTCHSRGPANALQIPAAQLELTGEQSLNRASFITSYAELMFTDTELELVDNSLTEVIIEVDTGEFEVDENDELILDEQGDPIPIIELQTIPVPPAASASGARSSDKLFDRFLGSADAIHSGLLSADEIKLLAEWLDIGGQYYNNPFDAPSDQ